MSNRTDNFNRTSSPTTLGTPSDAGSDWVALNGTWGIDTNQGYCAVQGSGGASSAVLESSNADCDVQVTITTIGACGVILRAVDLNNYLVLTTSTTQMILFKNVSASFTQIGEWTGSIANGDVFKIEGNGNTIKGYHNGVERISVSESTFNTYTRHGLFTYADTTTRFGTFSITDLGGSPPVAINDTATAIQGVAKTINVLANDTLNAATTLAIVSQGGNAATVTVNTNSTATVADDSVTYTAPSTFTGTDTFSYSISDGATTASATVTVTVSAPASGLVGSVFQSPVIR